MGRLVCLVVKAHVSLGTKLRSHKGIRIDYLVRVLDHLYAPSLEDKERERNRKTRYGEPQILPWRSLFMGLAALKIMSIDVHTQQTLGFSTHGRGLLLFKGAQGELGGW
jgi:hypothetical protein